MTIHREILALIPARGGSKGVKRKNIRLVNGKPLIGYSIAVALASKRITRVVVSTEDEEIAEVARGCGAEVPFLRPKNLARDDSSLGAVHDHALDTLGRREGYFPDALCTMVPTHPFRTRRLVDNLLAQLDTGIQSVISVVRVQWENLCLGDGRPVPLQFSMTVPEPYRKDIPFFRPYGLFSCSTLSQSNGLLYHEIKNPVSKIDIDYPSDLALADAILRQGLFDFEEGYRGCWG
jgi:hypothetical protein